MSSGSDDEDQELNPEEMPMDISILLNREVYFVNQNIDGVVIIHNEHHRKMRGVKLTLKCRAEVLWWDQKGKNKNFNDSTIMHAEKYIMGDGKLTYLEPGTHEIPFSLPLQSKNDLPSSMEFPRGFVRYTLRVEVDWPWASVQDGVRLVNVLNVCNLRDHRESLQPATFTSQCKVGFPTIKHVNISGRLEKIAYVPGEEILLNVEVNNESRSTLPIYIRLNQIVHYCSSDGKHHTTKLTIIENKYPAILRNSDFTLTNTSILIPPVPQSGRVTCDFMKLNYEIEIAVIVSGKMRKATNGIFIGTLPTKNHYKRFEKGEIPKRSVALWPFDHIANLPYFKFDVTPNNPDIDYSNLASLDPKYQLQYNVFRFDKDIAVRMINAGDFDDSDDDGMDDGSDVMSEFSL